MPLVYKFARGSYEPKERGQYPYGVLTARMEQWGGGQHICVSQVEPAERVVKDTKVLHKKVKWIESSSFEREVSKDKTIASNLTKSSSPYVLSPVCNRRGPDVMLSLFYCTRLSLPSLLCPETAPCSKACILKVSLIL